MTTLDYAFWAGLAVFAIWGCFRVRWHIRLNREINAILATPRAKRTPAQQARMDELLKQHYQEPEES